MVLVNDNYLKLKAGYLFPEIARRVKAFSEAHPEAQLIRLGIGDVTEPLPAACREAMKQAIDAMGTRQGFHGYGPEQGYGWLREAIARQDFQSRGCEVSADEIFVSDGSKCDSSNILDILGAGNRVAVTDPVYPVYVDSNVMAGRTGEADEGGRYSGLTYLPLTAANGFVAPLPEQPVDLIYLCFPNNPTGAVATREQLQAVGGLCPGPRRPDSVRRRLRGLHLRSRICPIPSMRSKGRAAAPSSSAPSPRTPASRAPAAPSPWCPGGSRAPRPRGRRWSFGGCGTGARAPSSTV